jgi:hypothetical protein
MQRRLVVFPIRFAPQGHSNPSLVRPNSCRFPTEACELDPRKKLPGKEGIREEEGVEE